MQHLPSIDTTPLFLPLSSRLIVLLNSLYTQHWVHDGLAILCKRLHRIALSLRDQSAMGQPKGQTLGVNHEVIADAASDNLAPASAKRHCPVIRECAAHFDQHIQILQRMLFVHPRHRRIGQESRAVLHIAITAAYQIHLRYSW